jgi:hypothetical protein
MLGDEGSLAVSQTIGVEEEEEQALPSPSRRWLPRHWGRTGNWRFYEGYHHTDLDNVFLVHFKMKGGQEENMAADVYRITPLR